MGRDVAIGIQDFGKLIENNYFYIDKTAFIKEWWENGDDVTLITRPRRFGKTLTMSMLDYFFSIHHAGCGSLFEEFNIWQHKEYRELQGSYPVLFLSFAGIKESTYQSVRYHITQMIEDLYNQYAWMLEEDRFTDIDRAFFKKVNAEMPDPVAGISIKRLCDWLYQYYGKRVLVFLDEYDTPMQEAYVNGYWEELALFTRSLFNNTFKTNPSMERAVMTGITRVGRESIFSDMNNLRVITTTSKEYADCFGFTEKEVFEAMEKQGLPENEKADVKKWYDGFSFGDVTDIYNPWSIINYLREERIDTYWANTSSNALVSRLVQTGDSDLKMQFERLMQRESIEVQMDEQIIFDQLDSDPDAIWSLLLASGYIKVLQREFYGEIKNRQKPKYILTFTNLEVSTMFDGIINNWFKKSRGFNKFVVAMFQGDVQSMNHYMNDMALNTFSYFDSGKKPSSDAPERFYHGFVLGLLVENAADYMIASNRESGFGRYDVVLEPRDKSKTAIIMEFKVFNSGEEDTLSDTADAALKQIEEKRYAADLLYRGISEQNVLKYALAFKGQACLIKKADVSK